MEDRRSSAAARGFPGVRRWFLLCAAAVSVSCGGPDSIGRTPEATPSAAKVPPRRDFTISISPLVQSVADGATTSYKVSAAAISGGAQNIQLSLSALPSGVTGAFTPSTIATGHKAVLAIAAGAGAPPTTATFTVTGDNSSVTHTASATLTVLDHTPAAATLLSPPAGSLLAGSVDVSAAASDNVAVSRLEIWLDDTVLASTAGAALVSTWDTTAAADGPHTLTAVAYDTSGNAGSSPPLQVTVGNSPSDRDFAIAIVALPAPVADGGTTGFSVSTTALTGTPQPLALAVSGLPPGVTAAFDRSTLTSGESANVTLSAAADAPGGPFNFTVTAAGIYASRSAAGSGTVVDTLAPAVAMPVPLVMQGSSELRLSAADNTGVARGEIRVDGALVATAFSYSWDTTAASDGSHVVEGRAYDLAGNVGSTGALITTVQNSAATRDFVLGLSPGSRTVGDGASATFSVDTSALLGAPQTVQLSLPGLPAGVTGVLQPPAIGPGTTATLTLNAAPAAAPWTGSICVAGTGVYTTHQACGQLTVVDSTAPVVGFSAPQSGAQLAGTVGVQASATDNIGVVRSELYLDGALVASGPSWSWDTTASADGAHTLEAAGWDAAGNRGSSGQRQVTVQNSAATRDFSVSISPSGATVNQGLAATYTIATATLKGAPQTLTLALCCEYTDLTGVSVTFSRTTITSGETATLTLATSSWTPATFHMLTFTAAGAYTTRAVPLTLSIRDVTRPTATIVAPAAGATVSGTVNLIASASDNTRYSLQHMRLLLDGVELLQQDANSLQVPLDTTRLWDGPHTLSLTVWDSSLNSASATSAFTVQNSAATRDFSLTLSAPDVLLAAGGTPVFLEIWTAQVVGSPEPVQFFVVQAPAGVTATIVQGLLLLTAGPDAASGEVIVGGSGMYATHTTSAAVVVGDQPSVTVSPSGGVVAGVVTLTGSALDSSGTGIEMVSLGLDYNGVTATAPGATATATWDSTAAPDGSTHTLFARATDNAGGTRFASGTFTVQNSAATRDFSFALDQTSLTLSSSTPAVLGVTTAETIGFPQPLNIVGSADPWCLQVRGANLIAGQTAAVTVDASSCGASPVGTLTLTVTGLYSSRSASIPVTVIDDTLPSFVSNSPPDGAILSGIATLTTIASDPGTPLVSRIAVDGVPVGQGAGYVQTSYDSRQLPDGPHAISYEAVDASGNAASQTVHVTVLNAPASHDLALNGGFESLAPSGALIGWTTGGTKPPVRSANAHGGAWSLGLGTQPGSGTSVASQLMWIPSQATSAALTLWARGTVAAGTTVGTDWQEAAVYDRSGALLRSLAHQQITSGWTQLSADLAGYAGQVVELRLTTQGGAGTSLWIDDVALIEAPDGVGGAAPCLGGGNALYLDGTAGDWVHPGMETITAGPWYAYADPASGMVQITSAGSQYWGARFARRPLEPGIGEGATRAVIASYGAGIDVSGNGRGCNQTSGRIQVIEAAVDAAGALRSFTATFEQSCETWMPLLRGCVHYQSAAASGREGELRAGLPR